MKTSSKFALAGGALILGIALIVAVFAFAPKAKPRPQLEAEPLLAYTTQASPQTHTIDVHTQGTLEPKARVKLAAMVSGEIASVHSDFDVGQPVTKGQVLLELDSREYRYTLSRAQAQLATAEEALAQELGRAFQAKKEWRDLGNAAANDLFLRKPQLASAKAALAAAKADVAQAELNIERTRIKAPFSGVISQRMADVGQWVSVSTPVAELIDHTRAVVPLRLTHKERALISLDPTQQPRASFTSALMGVSQTWQGAITRVAPDVGSLNRLYTVYADLSAEGNPAFRFGTFVNATIAGSPIKNVVKLPHTALYNGAWVYVVEPNNTIGIYPANVLQSSRDFVWLLAPVDKPARYVIRDQALMHAGMAVTLAPQEANAASGAKGKASHE